MGKNHAKLESYSVAYGRPNVSKFAKLKFVVAILNSLSLNLNSLSLNLNSLSLS